MSFIFKVDLLFKKRENSIILCIKIPFLFFVVIYTHAFSYFNVN